MADLSVDQVTYLHGDLDLHIISARDLPNMDIVSEHLRRCLTICRIPSSGGGDEGDRSREYDGGNEHEGDHEAHRRPKIITSDPYVTVKVPQATVARTSVIKNSQNPRWDQKFNIQLAHPVIDLEIQVKDDDVFGAEVIGIAKIPAKQVASGKEISGWFPLIGPSGKPPKPHTAIQLKMKFIEVEKNPLYEHGIAGDPDHLGVRHSYFPLRKGSHVTLYQDAHRTDDLPEIILDGHNPYRHEKCWEDICHAISEAHHLIYIVGWSVFQKIKLVREKTRPLPRGGDLTLGELLKYKSEEGVRVLLLVWDDRTSHDKYLINTQGVMLTHDEETLKFFKHSSVNCVLVPRYASSKLGYIKQKVVGTMFTHHQKCVLVDTQASGNNRKITAFIGGIDLCDGRYDTPEHRLFRHLDTVFKDDFHNPTFSVGTEAPRQPWHDLHCKIEGPAAYDVLVNFEQRWKRATRFKEFSLLFKGKKHWSDDSLIKIERISWILSPKALDPSDSQDRFSFLINSHRRDPEEGITSIPKDNPELYIFSEEDPENWHVQIFRSIDSGSLKGFPTKNEALAQKQNLFVSKHLVIERSIQSAYVQAIRSAQHFIYIENQYFLGSSYAWPNYKNAGADNLIPMELALKVANKIRANERFAVYIVIPMWPEGDPQTATTQEILFWQSQTMQMMYTIVAEALKDMQLVDAHPQDYLNFYCLGKREDPPRDVASEASESSASNKPVSASYKFGRFMIYVHAKGMIVDDEYVILGSANINQRSLAGTKDTEIAMGAYQPHHTWAEQKRHPHGQVYGYRMSLWAEHLGMKEVEEWYEDPSSLTCVKKVNEIGVSNWKKFSDESMVMLQGHLLKYPIQVDADGTVGPLPGSEEFPDVGGKVLGAYSSTLPDILTT